VVEIALSKIDSALFDLWIKISLFIKNKIDFKINIKVLENELNLAIRWKDPSIDMLLSCQLPMLEGWEIKSNKTMLPLLCGLSELKLYIVHVKINRRIDNISPIYLPI
jgi:hypothetical protein